MNTCNECVHHGPPAVLDGSHPCVTCDGMRVVLNGSNFKAKEPRLFPVIRSFCDAMTRSLDSCGMRSVYNADPDPHRNTAAHATVEVHDADKE